MKSVAIFMLGLLVGCTLALAINSYAKPSACYPLNKETGINVCMKGEQQ